MKRALLPFLIGMSGCVAIVDVPNISGEGAGGTGPGSGGSGVVGTGGASVPVDVGTGGRLGSGGSFGSGGASSIGTGGASTPDAGVGTGGRAATPDAGATDARATGSGGAMGAGGSRPDAGTGSGGVTGSGGATGTGGATTAAVCTSNVQWNGATGPTMRPGNTCNSCHSWTIAGTIYPTAHEPTNCNGVNNSAIRVIITGANGTTLTLTPNAAGNFYSTTAVATPFTARVTLGAATRAMGAMQTSGNCNSCHTQNGANGAPGRIMVP